MDKLTYVSPWGPWQITASDVGVVSVETQQNGLYFSDNPHLCQVKEQLDLYFAGIPTSFSVPIDLRGTEFQLSVWEILREIPYGETRSYSDIAQILGKPEAVRAVGHAVGRNPCLVLVPCHRVIGKNGNLTGFSAGIELKVNLLRLEHILER